MLKNALASFLLFASVALADYSYQTFPHADEILLTSVPLTVYWQVKPGVSPESKLNAPDLIRISLGSKSADGTPKVHWPPLNGIGNTVALNALKFEWNWNPTLFKDDPLPPRGKKGEGSQFFFQIADGQGYISSGQPFYIVESGTPSTAAPSPGAAASGSTGAGATNTNTNPSGSGNGNSQSKPPTGSAGSVNSPLPAAASTQSDSAILSPQMAVAAAALIASAAGSVL